jgi:heme-degrading monooxygenase HmoA
MVGRVWHGWTSREHADAYEELLRGKGPSAQRGKGRKGAYVLRKDSDEEVEFIVLTLFESLDTVKDLLGEDYEAAAVLLPGARELLSRFDERCEHYEVVVEPR